MTAQNQTAEAATPKPKEGTWTLTAPDGRTWQAESPLKTCGAEQRERVPADIALQRIYAARTEPVEVSRVEPIGEVLNNEMNAILYGALPPGTKLYTAPPSATPAAEPESTGRVSEIEGQARIRWLKNLVEKQQDENRSNGYVEDDTNAWVGPDWVETVHEALDELVATAEASKGFRFKNTSCSSCGKAFGPGDHGYSHCSDHATPARPCGNCESLTGSCSLHSGL